MAQVLPERALAVKSLEDQVVAAAPADKPRLSNELNQLVLAIRSDLSPEQQKALRKAELKSIAWKPLWAAPALFAAVILVLFVGLFRPKQKAQPGISTVG
jgi:hypothetical protein